jgi:hypothetical protein
MRSQANNIQKNVYFVMLKIISFLQVHIDRHKADTPKQILALVILSIPLNQFPKLFVIFVGGGILYMKNIIHHIKRAKGHERNKNSTVSSRSQKQHILHLIHALFAKLSFVSKTLLLKNHINILILSDIFNFQRYLRKNLVLSFIKLRYIDLIVNIPVRDSFHTNLSRSIES